MNCICTVYNEDIPCSIYKEYPWYITGISNLEWYIHSIYMVYTWYIKSIWRPHPYGRYIPCKNLMGLFSTFFKIETHNISQVYPQDIHGISQVYNYTMYIPCICHVYTWYIHGIYIVYYILHPVAGVAEERAGARLPTCWAAPTYCHAGTATRARTRAHPHVRAHPSARAPCSSPASAPEFRQHRSCKRNQ